MRLTSHCAEPPVRLSSAFRASHNALLRAFLLAMARLILTPMTSLGLDDGGRIVGSGMYVYRLTGSEGTLVKRMALLK